MRTLITVIVVILAAAVCSEVLLNHHPVKAAAALAPATPAPQAAYEQAAKAEQQLTAENASAIIAEYKQVITLQPGSEWGRKAQARIEAVEARVKAEDLRKSVFQEHGVD